MVEKDSEEETLWRKDTIRVWKLHMMENIINR